MTRRESSSVTTRYTQWDGTQQLKLDADKVFEKLAEYLSYTDDVRQAMDWMTRQGMDFDGSRVAGLEEFLEQLRQEMRQRYREFNLKEALSELEQRLNQWQVSILSCCKHLPEIFFRWMFPHIFGQPYGPFFWS